MRSGNVSGRIGEQKAEEYLKRNGYRIIDRNYSCRFGEIDIIAENDGFIVFAEVKTRKTNSCVSGREYVTVSKQNKILITSRFWLQSHGSCSLQPRFDVIEVQYSEIDGCFMTESIEHISNAFC